VRAVAVCCRSLRDRQLGLLAGCACHAGVLTGTVLPSPFSCSGAAASASRTTTTATDPIGPRARERWAPWLVRMQLMPGSSCRSLEPRDGGCLRAAPLPSLDTCTFFCA
jgi:hypothetical protein